MDAALKKIYKKKNIEIKDILIPKKTTEKATIVEIIANNFDFTGDAKSIVAFLEDCIETYDDVWVDKVGCNYYYDDEYDESYHTVIGHRQETDGEWAARQEYHRKKKENGKIAKAKAKEKALAQKKLEEEKERQEYERLKKKFEKEGILLG